MNVWEEFSQKCEFRTLCDCEQNFLCNHPDNDEFICEEEHCINYQKDKK